MIELAVRPELPSAEEYVRLRRDTGLSARSVEAAELGLPNSLFAVCVRDGAELVGMGRIIGDGGCNYEIVDMAVHPDYQRQGIGKRIMEALMNWLHEHAPPTAYVCLIADDHAPELYAQFGFEPVAPRSIGMALKI